jgi:DinB superfamily
MNQHLKEAFWKQFGASIDAVENAIKMCPPKLWTGEQKFWYNAYHCLFWLDYYLTLEPTNFVPPEPFSLSEFDDVLPERTYTKDEVLQYLQFCRQKCHELISGLTDEIAEKRWVNEHVNYSVLEILLNNMRHTQHHAAQLSMILRQEINDAPEWVARTKIDL